MGDRFQATGKIPSSWFSDWKKPYKLNPSQKDIQLISLTSTAKGSYLPLDKVCNAFFVQNEEHGFSSWPV